MTLTEFNVPTTYAASIQVVNLSLGPYLFWDLILYPVFGVIIAGAKGISTFEAWSGIGSFRVSPSRKKNASEYGVAFGWGKELGMDY